jgi:hypothetical protein
VATDSRAKLPRVSKSVEHGLEVVLAALWLGGSAYLREVLHTGWSGPIILLVVVVVLELIFVVWNRGGLKAMKEAEKKASEG